MRGNPIVSAARDSARVFAPADPWAHALAVAQIEGQAAAYERAALALELYVAARASLDALAPAGVAVSRDQLRLVVGGA